MKASSAQKLGTRGSNASRPTTVHRTATDSGTMRVTAPIHTITRNQTSIRHDVVLPTSSMAKIEAPVDLRTSRSLFHATTNSSGRTTLRMPQPSVPLQPIKQYEQTASAKVSHTTEAILTAALKARQNRPPPAVIDKQRASLIEKSRTSMIRADRSVPAKVSDSHPFKSRFFDAPTPSFRLPTPSSRVPSLHPTTRTPTAALHTYGPAAGRPSLLGALAAGGLTTPSHNGLTPSNTTSAITAHKSAVPSSFHNSVLLHRPDSTPHNSGAVTPHTRVQGPLLGGGTAPTMAAGGGLPPMPTLAGGATPHNGQTIPTGNITSYAPLNGTSYPSHVLPYTFTPSNRYRPAETGLRTPTYGHPLQVAVVSRHHRGHTPVHTMAGGGGHTSSRRTLAGGEGASTPHGALAAAARLAMPHTKTDTAAPTPTSTHRATTNNAHTLATGFTRAVAGQDRQANHKRLPFLENKHMTKDANGALAPTPLADGARRTVFPTHKSYTPTNATTATSTPTQTPAIYSPMPVHNLRRHDELILYEDQIIKLLDGRPLNHTEKILKDAPSQLRSICFSPRRGRCYKLVRVLQSAIYGGVFEAEIYDRSRLRPSHGKPPPNGRAAVKIMLRAVEIQHKDSLQEDIEAEVNFQLEMKGHRNVLSYDELWEDKDRQVCFVVMPFAEFEDLFEVIRRRGAPFAEDEARWLFRQLLSGVQHLHRQNVGFRDHSLENVLMFRSEKDSMTIVPKITDPGQAVRFQRDSNGRPIELRAEKLFGKSFRPPEVYPPIQLYNPVKVDTFCMGWMLFFVVTKRQPFDRVQKDKEWSIIERGEFEKVVRLKSGARSLTHELIDLLKHMLDPNPKRRYDPAQCLAHPWFASYGDLPIDVHSIHGSSRGRRR